MRHRKKGNHLSRTSSHKTALMRNLAAQVIEHKEIKTTHAKAKELRGYVERLITYGKKGTVHHRRLAFKFLQDKQAVNSLFEEVAPSFENRNGGYTRIIKLGNRKGDNAPISLFQLVGFEKISDKAAAKAEKDKKKVAKKEKAAKETETKAQESAAEEPATQAEPEAPAEEKEAEKEDEEKKED
ncbi:MAG TPA: 50S ribosomal protein L17 [Caldithrix abyssi]|uniref:Large ribosomal subunit protein bL17 n=1 Tax=Caldithrix abyssi TaxID=187145 RepID=A0A7V4WTR4_CALAY|nr:50S ribosomal protein L17 [Caldithrix abyssi]